MNDRLPESSSGDEDHPEVPQAECSSVDYHPHQRHEVDRQRRLPGTAQEKYKTNSERRCIFQFMWMNSKTTEASSKGSSAGVF